MSTITVRIPDKLDSVIDEFCKKEDRSKSWLVKKALMEKLEDWQDLHDGVKALAEHKKNPKVKSSKDLMKELGLTHKDLE
jgi:predicted transcriptional regulator